MDTKLSVFSDLEPMNVCWVGKNLRQALSGLLWPYREMSWKKPSRRRWKGNVDTLVKIKRTSRDYGRTSLESQQATVAIREVLLKHFVTQVCSNLVC
jgi:hypothetical protein